MDGARNTDTTRTCFTYTTRKPHRTTTQTDGGAAPAHAALVLALELDLVRAQALAHLRAAQRAGFFIAYQLQVVDS